MDGNRMSQDGTRGKGTTGGGVPEKELRGKETQERKLKGREMSGKELQGKEALGKELQGKEAQEKEIHGKEAQKKEIQEETRKQGGCSRDTILARARGLKPDSDKKQASLLQIQAVIEAKKIHGTPPFGELVRIQLQYISAPFWLLQGGLLFLLGWLLFRLPGRGEELTDYLWWCSVAAAWMGVLSHGVLGKHFSHGMAELEQSCYINLSQMWTIRMALTTGVDIVVLTMLGGCIAARTDQFFGRVTVYLLVPFVLSNVCCLLAVSLLRGGRGRYTLAALTIVSALLGAAPSVFPDAYAAAYLWVWLCMLFLGAAVFAGQLRGCYGRMIRGEMICWN